MNLILYADFYCKLNKFIFIAILANGVFKYFPKAWEKILKSIKDRSRSTKNKKVGDTLYMYIHTTL